MNINLDKFREQRLNLLSHLRKRGIDEDVLTAMNQVPRELFIPHDFIKNSYEDIALPIDCNQTISQPYTVAFMTSLLKIQIDDKVLEIGTGSGYQASILYLLGARVFTVERIRELHENAKKKFIELGFKIISRYGDGTLGWKEFAPYKCIIVTAAAPKLPEILKQQLDIGGRLVVPVGGKNSQSMYLIERKGENDYAEFRHDSFKFVPLIGKEGWEE
ncbi:MAG: protein-L-isoaspartate(D-aspartate) O-methyltransferase [Bacteroidota bacterium]|nr:protein-L-isoaspartate(D-aspartate) O-methyltransferase [Bacteroidota bacterium]